jgi:hypothetical protein
MKDEVYRESLFDRSKASPPAETKGESSI